MHLLLPIIVIGIEIAYYGQRLPILVLWLQKLLVSYCYWYWYCRFAEDGSEIDVGIAKDKSLLLVLILLLFSEAIKYWYWYWYCTPEAKSIDIDIELKFLLSHTPVWSLYDCIISTFKKCKWQLPMNLVELNKVKYRRLKTEQNILLNFVIENFPFV